MKIECPKCGMKGSLTEEKIQKSGLMIICPKCKNNFYINKSGNTIMCSNCGYENLPGIEKCKSCGHSFMRNKSIFEESDVKKLHYIAISEMRDKKKSIEKLLFLKKSREYYQMHKAMETFKSLFYEAISDGVLTDFEIKYLKLFAEKNNLEWQDAISVVSKEASSFMESLLKTYFEDDILDLDEKRNMKKLSQVLNVDIEKKEEIIEKLDFSRRKAVELFKKKFKEFIADGVLTVQEIRELKKITGKYGLNWEHMMALVRSEAFDFVKSLVKTASKDNVIDDKEEKIINKAMKILELGEEEKYYIQGDILKVKANALELFGEIFIEKLKSPDFGEEEINVLKESANKYGLTWEKAIDSVGQEANEFVKELLLFARQDGILDKDEEKLIKRMVKLLKLPEVYKKEIYDEIKLIKKIQNIREGDLPVLTNPPIILKSGEIFHGEDTCIYIKTDKKKTKTKGKLIITSDRILFLGKDKSFKFPYKSIFNILLDAEEIYIDKQGQGRGKYEVKDSMIVFEILLYLIKKANFLITQRNEMEMSRHIPHDVKVEVYHRDGGKCVMCGDNRYLEFDHIIPVSKGGSSPPRNLQILCGKCNREKSADIA